MRQADNALLHKNSEMLRSCIPRMCIARVFMCHVRVSKQLQDV